MGSDIKKGNRIYDLARKLFIITKFDKYLSKATKGKHSNSLIGKLAPNNYQYKPNTFRTFSYYGIQLKVDISDYVGHYLYFGFKDAAHEKLISLVNKGDVILDIGTNIGSTLLQLSKTTGSEGKVYGFEPDKINYNSCLENIKLNSFNNVFVSNIGLGSEKGEYNLLVDTPTNRGGNRIVLNTNEAKNENKVYIEKLDDWLKLNNIGKVNLVKIDVEGFEKNVLLGGIQFLNRDKPILFIELDDNNLRLQNSNASDVVLFLTQFGYIVINAESGKIVQPSDDFTNCHYDIICRFK